MDSWKETNSTADPATATSPGVCSAENTKETLLDPAREWKVRTIDPTKHALRSLHLSMNILIPRDPVVPSQVRHLDPPGTHPPQVPPYLRFGTTGSLEEKDNTPTWLKNRTGCDPKKEESIAFWECVEVDLVGKAGCQGIVGRCTSEAVGTVNQCTRVILFGCPIDYPALYL